MRLVIADDSALLREGLQALCSEAGHEVVAAVGDGPALIDAAARHRPDVAVIDIRMPPSHTDEGLRAALTLRRQRPGAAILLLSQYVEVAYFDDLAATGTGALGYLLKDRVSEVDEFLAALETVASGGSVLDPDVVQQLLRRRRDPITTLTPRERDVLALMAQGHSNARIAAELVVTEGAVEKHTQRIFAKLNLGPEPGSHRRVTSVLSYLGSDLTHG